MDDVVAETPFKESGAAIHAFAILAAAEVIFEAASVLGPLDGPPLQQMADAESVVFDGRSQHVPAASCGADDHNSAQQASILVREQQTTPVLLTHTMSATRTSNPRSRGNLFVIASRLMSSGACP